MDAKTLLMMILGVGIIAAILYAIKPAETKPEPTGATQGEPKTKIVVTPSTGFSYAPVISPVVSPTVSPKVSPTIIVYPTSTPTPSPTPTPPTPTPTPAPSPTPTPPTPTPTPSTPRLLSVPPAVYSKIERLEA